MAKKTLALILVLIFLAGALFYLAYSQRSSSKLTVYNEPVQPTPTPVAQTTLSLMPNPLNTPTAAASVDVQINTSTNMVTAVQLELSYDPKMLGTVTVKPGTLFTNPTVLLNAVDPVKGTISYAIAIPPTGKGVQGAGSVATISFTVLQKGVPTNIKVEPKTLVTAEGITPSVLKSSTGTTITYQAGTPSTTSPTIPAQ